jgi:hypothetical protein
MPDSGKPGEASSAELEERTSGKPGDSPLAMPEDAGFGETRRGVGRWDGRSEKPGKPGDLLRGTAEGWEIRGDSKNRRRHGQKMRRRGNPKPQEKAGRVDVWFRKLRVHRD